MAQGEAFGTSSAEGLARTGIESGMFLWPYWGLILDRNGIERVQLFAFQSPLFALAIRLTQLAKISILRTFNGRCMHGVAPPTYATTRTAKEH